VTEIDRGDTQLLWDLFGQKEVPKTMWSQVEEFAKWHNLNEPWKGIDERIAEH
jgi:hypothetical protein